ncbi:MAG: hypothetical protein JW891_11960 [Candidatus Lokiarchaeota archaeon]|nr:hypothetical protein [Candidatus Lokiarchaeota archaeon]
MESLKDTIKQYKIPIITILVVIIVLMVMLAVGFQIGILSTDPDGLEKTLEDAGVQEPEPFFEAFLGWISNDYIAGILGIILTVSFILATYYILVYVKKKRKSAD